MREERCQNASPGPPTALPEPGVPASRLLLGDDKTSVS